MDMKYNKDIDLSLTPEKLLKTMTTNNITSMTSARESVPKMDSGLFVTPEKNIKTFKNKKSIKQLSVLAENILLDVTPEKTILSKNKDSKSRNRVRFNIPSENKESENDENSNGHNNTQSYSVNVPNHANIPFQTKAALYAQRNPLAEILDTDNEISLEPTYDSSTTGTTESTSWISGDTNTSSTSQNTGTTQNNNNSFNVKETSNWITSNNGHFLKESVHLVKKHCNALPADQQSKIIDISNVNKSVSSHKKINIVTKPKHSTKDNIQDQPFLRKKHGLQRCQHSVKYLTDNDKSQNPLGEANYNSSLAVGQELQSLRTEEFDNKTIQQKLSQNEELRIFVSEKTSIATNIAFEDKLYQNLISVDVVDNPNYWNDKVAHMPNFKKLKPTIKPPVKPTKYTTPSIMDNFDAQAMYEEEIVLDLKSLKICNLPLLQASIDDVMILDNHHIIWNNM